MQYSIGKYSRETEDILLPIMSLQFVRLEKNTSREIRSFFFKSVKQNALAQFILLNMKYFIIVSGRTELCDCKVPYITQIWHYPILFYRTLKYNSIP